MQVDKKKFSEFIAAKERIRKFSKENICFLHLKYSSILQREK